jgi:hypothetical protein
VFFKEIKADAATLRLPWAQQERRAVAGVVGADPVRAIALSGVCAPLATRVQTILLPAALERLGRHPSAELGQDLWDSRSDSVDAGGARTALFAWVEAVMGRRAGESHISYGTAGGRIGRDSREGRPKSAQTQIENQLKKL